MILGMPTLIETESISECAVLCNDLGLSFIELNMNMPQYQADRIDVSDLKRVSEEHGIFYTIHLDENLNVSDFNSYVADAYIRTVKRSISIAGQLGIPILNMHMSKGVYFTLLEKKEYLFSKYKEEYLCGIYKFKDTCENAVGNKDITICIENCDGYTDFQKEAIDILLRSPVFGLTFDVGHNHGCNGADEPYIIANKNRLHHMHLHDASGRKNHLALGSGELDVAGYLELAKERNCRIVLETKTIDGLRKSVEYLKSRKA